MPEESTRQEHKQTRRRARPRKPTAQRNYASENDASNSLSNPPRTPQKATSTASAHFAEVQDHGSLRRGAKDKPRTRHHPLSPDSTRVNRKLSPHPPSSQATTSAPAFAGATFHASPAPSSLPLPSFFKSSESPALKEELCAKPGSVEPETKLAFPTPLRISPQATAHESPLEIMFKADREERERARQTTHGQPTRHGISLPHSPSSMSPTRKGAVQSLQAHSPSPVRYNRLDIARSTPELDSHSPFNNHISPSFSTPFQERIRAAKNSGPSNLNGKKAGNTPQTTQSPSDKSEALKRYLFGVSQSPSINSLPSPAPPLAQAEPATITQTGRAEFSEVRDADVIAMENNLRRLLKLDSA